MAAIVQCEQVGVRLHGGRELLSGLNLVLAPGAIVLAVGARGTGKTLLAQLVAGLRLPDRGRVRLFGHDAATPGATDPSALRRRIGFAAERPDLVGGIALTDEVAVPLRLAGARAGAAREDAAELLRRLGSPAPLARSGAGTPPEERTRVAVARALAARPALVVLDAPFRAGDAVAAERLGPLLRELRDGGTAVLLTGDDAHAAAALPEAQLLQLAGGRLRAGADGAEPPLAGRPA